MFSKMLSCGVLGITGYIVEVETDISNGLPSFEIVGLGDATVKESKERVRSAIRHSGYEFPMKRITVNLAPANMRKEGSAYDLSIALGILVASNQLKQEQCLDYTFLGELSLDGSIKPVKGVLPMALCVMKSTIGHMVVATDNAGEAAIVEKITVFGVRNISGLVSHLTGKIQLAPCTVDINSLLGRSGSYDVDFADVKGQQSIKRALEIAVSGSHNFMMIGSPGSGKTMIAKRIPTIMPPLTFEEALEVTKIYSIAGLLPHDMPLMTCRPFRSPHHSVTNAGLIGGGNYPVPGEISLAHLGVLFLDELPEFRTSAAESLRQPIEEGSVTISRLSAAITYPSAMTLICAANPCRCGFLYEKGDKCKCSPKQIQEYRNKMSGPLLDRIDIQITVGPIAFEEINSKGIAECSSEIRKRVANVRKMQIERYKSKGFYFNAQLPQSLLSEYCKLDSKCTKVLKNAFERLGLSARAYSRILKVARTISDMDGSVKIKVEHIAEAIQYRCKDLTGIHN